MQSQPKLERKRTRGGRLAVALSAAALIATGLGADLLRAGADDIPMPTAEASLSQAQVPAPQTTTTEAPATGAPTSDKPATDAPGAPASGSGAAASDTPAPGTQPQADPQPTPKPGPAHPPAPTTTPAPATPAPAAPAAATPAATPAATSTGPAATSSGAQANSKRCPKSKTSTGSADPARYGSVVNSAASTKSAATGCAQKRARSAKKISKHDAAVAPSPLRNAGGLPTTTNPTTSLASPGPVPVGVPNFFIEKFRIPPFLLPIYQAAGTQYGIRWEVLAAINEIETDYGRNLNVSSAGALGWMQFMPATWKGYGVDANRDGRKDPFNPVDAIFAAARYLKAAGGDKDLRRGIFAYNHADWYVNSVLMRARLIGGIPADLIGSLSGLTQGHFPVYAKARYADDISERAVQRRVKAGTNAAMPIESSSQRRDINIYAQPNSPVIAVQDGTIISTGTSKRLGNYVRMRDVYGNDYTYGHLGSVATKVAVPKGKTQSQASVDKELSLPTHDPKPTAPASAGKQLPKQGAKSAAKPAVKPAAKAPVNPDAAPAAAPPVKERLFAHPTRKRVLAAGGARQLSELESALAVDASLKDYMTESYNLDRRDVVLKPLIAGRKVIAGTILGRIAQTADKTSPHVQFEIRPAGRGAPRIDPKPILDGWKLLESTAIYRAQGKNPLVGPGANASIGQILLMSKEALGRRVLADPRIEIYSCGRQDIEAGQIDRRILAVLEFLSSSGLKPTVSTLKCGHSYLTSSGNVSEHVSGNAVDIAKINGIPILGHQGKGSITDITIRRLLNLQGTMKPHQIISLMTFSGTDNTLSLPDHADHIHVGFHPGFGTDPNTAHQLDAVLKPAQWIKLIDRLGRINNPTVQDKPSKYAIRVQVRGSSAHQGE
ncbi:MAG: hypothetical protein QOG15_3726 [Solirubrobacteraceae bacterium]|jgi:membrane-bound lytic murein transglycosylase B|nr:hypothetical protein [Solirubrobacteraceae bacterium]